MFGLWLHTYLFTIIYAPFTTSVFFFTHIRTVIFMTLILFTHHIYPVMWHQLHVILKTQMSKVKQNQKFKMKYESARTKCSLTLSEHVMKSLHLAPSVWLTSTILTFAGTDTRPRLDLSVVEISGHDDPTWRGINLIVTRQVATCMFSES